MSAFRLGFETLEQRENPSTGFGCSNFASFWHPNSNHGGAHGSPAGHHGWHGCGGSRGHGGPSQPPPTTTGASLNGTVSKDTTGDGVADSPMSGMTVQLFDAKGVLVASTTTAADGSYHFTGLSAGTYSLALVTGNSATASVGFVDGTGDGTASGAMVSGIEVGTNQAGSNYNFTVSLPPA